MNYLKTDRNSKNYQSNIRFFKKELYTKKIGAIECINRVKTNLLENETKRVNFH